MTRILPTILSFLLFLLPQEGLVFSGFNSGASTPTIALDVVGAGVSATSGTTLTSAHTVTNGVTNSVVVVVGGWVSGNSSITGCTFNGNTMTQLWMARETTDNLMGSFGFIITTGTGDGVSHNVVCTMGFTITGSGAWQSTMSFKGVNQATPNRTASVANCNPSGIAITNCEVTPTSSSGDAVIDGFMFQAKEAVTSLTTLQNSFVNMGGNNASGYNSSIVPGAASQTMGYTFASVNNAGEIGAVALIP